MNKSACLILISLLSCLAGCLTSDRPEIAAATGEMKPKQLSAVYGAPHLKQFYGPPYKGAILPMHDAVDPEMPAKLNETKQQAAILAKKIPAPIMPTRLQIPAIKLNAIVEPVGILSNGQMGVPKAFDRVGLLAPWTKPGEKGNAVIDGHFDHYTGPAVFYGLRRLKPGDQVIVTGKAGTKLIFAVQTVESFKTKEAPIERIFGESDQRHLNLITCDGKFNRKTQQHARRLVVFTRLVEDEALAAK